MKKYIRLMLGAKSAHIDECLKGNFIGVDFDIEQDLSNHLFENWRDFNKMFIPIWLENHPGKSKVSAGLACGALWTVSKGLRRGDVIISPDGAGRYHIAEVLDEYRYHPGQVLPHRRTIRWYEQIIERAQMSDQLRNSTGSTGTTSQITNYATELEEYASVINSCYLTNKSDVPFEEIERINNWLNKNKLLGSPGLIRKCYSPKDDNNITKTDRIFYTNKNALIIDTLRDLIDQIDPNLQKYFIAPLLYRASVHTNTSGVFKGFYKDKVTKMGKFGGTAENTLSRIKGEIDLPIPIFSEYECDVTIYNKDTNLVVKEMPQVDITYYDPPYNQHPTAQIILC